MAGVNEAQCSDRFVTEKHGVPIHHESEHPNDLAIPCGHCAELRSCLPSEKISEIRENKNGNSLPCKV
ncbi:MAG: hypothetical protein LBC02_13700 [Planctomycetaceae bacterium]|jgi:hypothetical protein|nr:hypothetical protein [Planctomycetaceae bacterium]